MPTENTHDVVEQPARVAPGEEDRQPCGNGGQDHTDRQDEEDDVVRDGEQPLDEWQPPIEVGAHVGVGQLEVHGLLLVGRGVLVPQEQEVGEDPVVEAQVGEVEVEPPARVLLPEHDREQRREEQDPASEAQEEQAVAVGVAAERRSADRPDQDHDRDGEEQAEGARHPVELAVGSVDVELDRVGGHRVHGKAPLLFVAR